MDTNNINFNELWSGQEAAQPSTKDLLLRLDNFKKSNRRRIVITNLLLVATSMFILFIWLYYQPQMITTKIGIVLTILAMAIFIMYSNKNLGLLQETHEAESIQYYLKHLLAIKEKQQFIQTTILNVYFVLLSAGIALYMYEYTSRMTTFWAVFTYAITGSWILLNWFYLRPQQIKKQETKINELIGRIENMQKQLEE